MKKLILLLFFVSGCSSPYRVRTSLSPDINPCRYKTFSFVAPEDKTLTQWLSDPKHRQILDDILRGRLNEHGLTEVSPSSPPDLLVRQVLESSLNNANQTTEGVIMASDYKLAKWKIELAETRDGPAMWTAQMDTIIGDLQGQNLSRAQEGMRSAFNDYPPCKASHAP